MKQRISGKIVIVVCVLLLFSVGLLALFLFQIKEVEVRGNIHYTEEEIKEFVMGGVGEENGLVLMLKQQFTKPVEIPFVEKYTVKITNGNQVVITVYEKSIAGCIEYMGDYLYFDKDGIVVESIREKKEDILCVQGLEIPYVILYEPIPVEDKNLFSRVLTMTQLIARFEVPADTVYFNANQEIILQCDGVKVLLGKGDNLEEQISELHQILQNLEGRTGTLDMKTYTVEKGDLIFREQ